MACQIRRYSGINILDIAAEILYLHEDLKGKTTDLSVGWAQ